MATESSKPLPELLARLHDRRVRGQLAVRSGQDERRFLFVDGELRAARSTREDEKLGSWLVRRELLDEADKDELLRQLADGIAPSLGFLIADSGLLDQLTIDRELQHLALEIIRRAASRIPDSTFFTSSLEEDLPWDILPDFSTRQVILEVARSFPDGDGKRTAVRALGAAPLYLTQKMDDLLVEYELNPVEGFLLDRLRSPQPLKAVAAACGLPEDDAAGALYALWVAGLVTAKPATTAVGTASGAAALTPEQRDELDAIARLAPAAATMDHYSALEIELNARHDEVVAAWGRARSRWDPKRASEPHLADRRAALETLYRRAELAHEVLSSPSARARYDRLRQTVGSGGLQADRSVDDPRRAAAARELVMGNLGRARELIESGQARHAFTYLENASRLAADEEALLTLAGLLKRDEAWGRLALQTLRRLTDDHPRCVEGWIELAELWNRRGDAERQRKALERGLAVAPESRILRDMYQQAFGDKPLSRVLGRTGPSRR